MTQNKLDKLVINLQTTLESLVAKVNGLEQVIGAQNVLIKKQGDKIQELVSLSTGTTNAHPTAIPTDTETKPAARTARLRASAAIASGTNSKSTNSTAKTLPRTAAEARSDALAGTAVSRTTRRTSGAESYACMATPPATATSQIKPTLPSLDPELPREQNIIEAIDEGDWKKVSKKSQKNNKRERAVVRGSGIFACDLQTVERAKKIHACFFKPDTSEDTLKSFMEQKNPSDGYLVKKIKLKHNHYSSFIITVPESKYNFFMSADNWPAGTEVSEWFRRSEGRAVRPPANGREFRGHFDFKPTTRIAA